MGRCSGSGTGPSEEGSSLAKASVPFIMIVHISYVTLCAVYYTFHDMYPTTCYITQQQLHGQPRDRLHLGGIAALQGHEEALSEVADLPGLRVAAAGATRNQRTHPTHKYSGPACPSPKALDRQRKNWDPLLSVGSLRFGRFFPLTLLLLLILAALQLACRRWGVQVGDTVDRQRLAS